ncbi:DDHD domain-containing protein [Neohortaea acidophila]|uniref:DDHD domain-containing protein n=1 Tax=Neohortaea acidophila TaxID=245834 RepID=A0A6A6PSW0_9PEZI|nr:DDHD domain-containing protein [Neohortaea acidophila]KAF2483188.1 DDHD domain-containing protein [Neohortaea acidophila]
MASEANQYIRKALHNTPPPPPIRARFFYASPVPIDDPLSPLPPSTQGSASAKQPAKAFSEYDNIALDKAWHELRQRVLKFRGKQNERSRSKETSRTRARAGSVRDGRRRSDSATNSIASRSRVARSAAARSGIMEDSEDEDEGAADDSHLPITAAEVSTSPNTTGNPFIRAPSRTKIRALQQEERAARPKMATRDTYEWDDASHLAEHSPAPEVREKDEDPHAKVVVGVSRLHQVEMPELQMTPIYWTPIQDTAPVVRGTWFYQDTMLPVETAVANMLEAGYVDRQVWTETWKDELNSAVEVGAAGEMKIVHKLWPEQMPDSRPVSRRGTADVFTDDIVQEATSALVEDPDTPEQAREKAVQAACAIIDIASGANGADNKASGTPVYGYQGQVRSFADFGVIYANKKEARLLKPSLMPSEYFGRRPLANYIRKGYKLGIAVVRGFDQALWNKLHPPKTTAKAEKANRGAAASSATAPAIPPHVTSKADVGIGDADRPQVTDLILIVHGIGQKWASRYESFHFTHAINSFRREINVELGSPEIRARLRDGLGGIMALPVNWRHSLSFEEGGYRDDDSTVNEFSLADITPETLPSVRNIVSDVMLDIPYYMSHHQSKMISAVIREANRVYQLWCKNNPGFAKNGRVHLIAHSLGSVMAIDILSRQPTIVPDRLSDPTTINLESEHLEHFLFNTSNLYLAGSPAGFFLLLKKAQLLPRIDHPSAVALEDPSSNTSTICGERGQYGCIAVENVYNIINPYDPVAYRMNAAVDAAYSASLKQAHIPSATPGWFGVGTKTSLFSGKTSSIKPTAAKNTASTTPTTTLPRLPSNVELETHNFTREERAEKRMYLLNDNGQIDFFVRYGGGAFDIQYLTMLSAHSSYWLLKDFVRMVVTETGRREGKQGAFLGMRAEKRRKGPR